MAVSEKAFVFAREYLVDINATQAAIRSGYSPRTATSQGSRLLKDVEVQAEIERLRRAVERRTDITVDRTMTELGKIAFASMRQFIRIDPDGQPRIDLTETPPEALDALAEIHTETVVEHQGRDAATLFVRKVKLKLHDKLGALDKLMRRLGAYEQDNEQQGKGAASILAQIWARGGSRMPIAKDEDEASDP